MGKYKNERCPGCGEQRLVGLYYGMPKWEVYRQQEQGKSMFGGCMLKQNSKRWGCLACGIRGTDDDLSAKEQPS